MRACKNGHSALRWASNGHCFDCDRERKAAMGPDARKADCARSKRWAARNPGAVARRAKVWRQANVEYLQTFYRRRKGLPEPTRECPPTCEICNRPPNKRALALDHDHVTGKFRGWLCENCNNGLGRFKDNITLLLQAAIYLETTR